MTANAAEPLVLAAPVRTRVGRFGGALAALSAADLAAAAAAACLAELPFADRRLNPDGGAIALGQPIGCTGTPILATLPQGLADREGRRGLETPGVSGGIGLAALVERA